MDAIDFIKQDHRRIEDLFGKFLEAESDATQEQLHQDIQTGLNAHAEMEESVLYRDLQPFAEDKVRESIEEHSEVKRILAELLGEDLNEEDFETRFNQLIEDWKHHVEKEESPGGILELAREHFDDRKLSEMAADMQKIQQHTREELAA